MQTLILLLGIALLIVAAYGDIKSLRIPNNLAIAVAGLGFIRLIVMADPGAVFHTILASFIIFIVTFLLFSRGILGGGDVKLLSATVLLVGYRDLFLYLLMMSICGALVSLAVFCIHNYLPLCLGPRLAVLMPKARLAVPYGVAIAGAGIGTLLLQSSLLG